jgi:hypothetical protein
MFTWDSIGKKKVVLFSYVQLGTRGYNPIISFIFKVDTACSNRIKTYSLLHIGMSHNLACHPIEIEIHRMQVAFTNAGHGCTGKITLKFYHSEGTNLVCESGARNKEREARIKGAGSRDS